MLDQIKNYVLLIAGAIVAVLFLLLKRSSSKVATLETEKQVLSIDKDLAKIKEESDASEQEYINNKSAYDKLKLLKRPKA